MLRRKLHRFLIQKKKKILVEVKDVQQQTNSTDCAVFAIAFTTALCFGLDPCSLHFNRRDLRMNLWECLSEKKFKMFPHTLRSPARSKLVSFDVHCTCRQLFEKASGIRMVQCETCQIWYHETCHEIPGAFFRSYKLKVWHCLACR